MQIRFLANSKGKSFTILGFESENERAAFFDCLQKSDAFLGDLRQRLDFSSLVKQLESRSAKQIAMDRVAVATPIRGEELTKLLGGIMDILRRRASSMPNRLRGIWKSRRCSRMICSKISDEKTRV